MQKGQTIYCLFQSVYAEHITKGIAYHIVDVKDEKVRIKGDNGKLVWIPADCFVSYPSLIPLC